jgi:hypothetical protein
LVRRDNGTDRKAPDAPSKSRTKDGFANPNNLEHPDYNGNSRSHVVDRRAVGLRRNDYYFRDRIGGKYRGAGTVHRSDHAVRHR